MERTSHTLTRERAHVHYSKCIEKRKEEHTHTDTRRASLFSSHILECIIKMNDWLVYSESESVLLTRFFQKINTSKTVLRLCRREWEPLYPRMLDSISNFLVPIYFVFCHKTILFAISSGKRLGLGAAHTSGETRERERKRMFKTE